MKIFIYILFITISATGYSQTNISGVANDGKTRTSTGAGITISDISEGAVVENIRTSLFYRHRERPATSINYVESYKQNRNVIMPDVD